MHTSKHIRVFILHDADQVLLADYKVTARYDRGNEFLAWQKFALIDWH